MICSRCTAESCAICGLKWKTCDCPWFNFEALETDWLNHRQVPEEEDVKDIPGSQERRRSHHISHSPTWKYGLTRYVDTIHNLREQKVHYKVYTEEETSRRGAASTRYERAAYREHRSTIPTTTKIPCEHKKSRRNQVYSFGISSLYETVPEKSVPGNKTIPAAPREQLSEKYDILLQPETKPLSQDKLAEEVESIYAKLEKVEENCVEVNDQQTKLATTDWPQLQLSNEQWQALITSQKSLLDEYHDFFLTSQHPSASLAVRRLARKYSMPARIRRYGITNFFELLKQHLPASQEHMIAFIHLSYSTMTLLYETVPAFQYTWINCLADIARYRAVIEDGDTKDRDVWAGIVGYWSSEAAAKSRKIRGLPLLNFTRFSDDIHQRIAGFLLFEDLIQLSLSCKKLRAVYEPALIESFRVSPIAFILVV